jgi:hypothetical protein
MKKGWEEKKECNYQNSSKLKGELPYGNNPIQTN